MTIAQLAEWMKQFHHKNAKYDVNIKKVMTKMAALNDDEISMAALKAVSEADFFSCFYEFCLANHKDKLGTVFKVHGDYPEYTKEQMRVAEQNEHLAKWVNSLKALPAYTLPLKKVDRAFIQKAKAIWAQNVCGYDDILQIVLSHSLEYGNTGKTSPILLVGSPGIGKTHIARQYSKILDLPCYFLSGPSASGHRGLAGDPNVFVGAGAGEIVQGMINTGCGNPLIFIDEIDKAIGGHHGASFQDELLSALDENNTHWRDNFLEVEINAEHIPYVFTANDKSAIPDPLLDRMEVIEMQEPSKEQLHNITTCHTIPDTFKSYDDTDAHVQLKDEHVDYLVDLLYREGNTSCRAYQKAVKMLVSEAYLNSLVLERSIEISKGRIENAVERCSGSKKTRRIGF